MLQNATTYLKTFQNTQEVLQNAENMLHNSLKNAAKCFLMLFNAQNVIKYVSK
jgi:hypothetical protein